MLVDHLLHRISPALSLLASTSALCGWMALSLAGFTLGCSSSECRDCESAEDTTEDTDDGEPVPVATEPPKAVQAYADCVNSTVSCGHGQEPHCLVDDTDEPTVGVCSSYCEDSDCPPGPDVTTSQGYTAYANCVELEGNEAQCVLDCFGGLSCPEGMVCLPHGICGHLTASAVDPYADCGECGATSLGCLSITGGEVCLPPYQSFPCPSPRSGTAVPSPIEAEGSRGCMLFCDLGSFGRSCPSGMSCTPFGFGGICVWAPTDCAQVECGPAAECQLVNGTAQCLCPDGLPSFDDDCDPCDRFPCHYTADCVVVDDQAECRCDDDETMASDGRCVEEM